MVHSICTLADHRAYGELLIMLKSLSLFAKLDLYVAGDRVVCERLRHENLSNRLFVHHLLPDELHTTQGEPEWLQFMMRKMDIIETAVDKSGDTLFVDADMVFFHAPFDVDLARHEVALSPHMILAAEEQKFGRYNGGYVGTSSRRFPQWWREAVPKSRYYEQACLEEAPAAFRTQELGIHHNFGWWRLNQCDPKRTWWRFDLPHRPLCRERLSQFRVDGERVLFADQPLVSVHTHILNRERRGYQSANRLALDLLSRSRDPRHGEILGWIK